MLPERSVALDGLRGVACLFIVLLHVGWSSHITDNNVIRSGYLFVDAFFILSGFVVARQDFSGLSDRVRIRNFMARRFFRIYPLHLVTLAAFVALELFKLREQHKGIPMTTPAFTGSSSVAALIANVFMVQGLGLFNTLTWNGPSWYISCLFAIYVLFSLGFFSVAFRNAATLTAAIIAVLAGYVALAVTHNCLDITGKFAIVRGICGFFLGMVLYRSLRRYGHVLSAGMPPLLLSAIEIALAVALISVMSLGESWLSVLAIPVFFFMIGVLHADHGIVAGLLKTRVLVFLGKVSYSVYMVHGFVLTIVALYLHKVLGCAPAEGAINETARYFMDPLKGDIVLACYVALVLFAGTLAYLLVERPIYSYGAKLFSSARAPRGADAS